MSVATVTTDINIGPFKIPSNGQNMIMNNYVHRKNIKVEFVIPEPMSSNQLATTQWCHKDYKFTKVILCSIYQLPRNKNDLNLLIKNMENVEFHFALEGISGKGKNFLLACSKESAIFENSKKLKIKETDWLNLYKLFKSKSLD